jgi:hypothetical protein
MPKYYIHSGSLDFVTEAADARGAALWALHCWLDARCNPDSVGESDTSGEIHLLRFFEAVAQLDERVVASEYGFAGDEAGVFETGALVEEWRQLWLIVTQVAM